MLSTLETDLVASEWYGETWLDDSLDGVMEEANDDAGDTLSRRTGKVIPYVEDFRNCLVFQPAAHSSPACLTSLQAALKSGIQVTYQIEDNELAAEPLPSVDDRRHILFYEAAEGGAGVLRRLVDGSGGGTPTWDASDGGTQSEEHGADLNLFAAEWNDPVATNILEALGGQGPQQEESLPLSKDEP